MGYVCLGLSCPVDIFLHCYPAATGLFYVSVLRGLIGKGGRVESYIKYTI